ncbi:aminotransferase class I/II-fold pyridoxal phosphate-dependent enzyme [Paludifilum halophilum]|uniref:Aminotransferase n=1 Tax=Paludifilum halophilum TaxID=1642702 RepID=A0A235BB69_9BACL|nr:aminotransferase class I/II-fold pyridoxal phosphate-dependent enzyme [Paludifilum halophilum]OYD08815.1 LL-diaminopimelate aminotransferase [Paludifilum halophilum]
MDIQASNHIQQLRRGIFNEILDEKRRLEKEGKSLIDLSIGSPDLPPPDFVTEIIQHASKDYFYTMGAIPTFNGKVADFYNDRYDVKLHPESEVLQLIGSQDGLAHLATAMINPGDYVLVPDPGYPIFEVGVRIAGGQPYPLPLTEENDYLPRLDRVPQHILNRAKMMILNYPANPVTATADRSFFKEVVRFAQKYNILVVHDFTYSELVFDGKRGISLLSVPGAKEVGVEFNSFSKTFNMAGCRIGYMAGNEKVLNIMETMMSHTQYGIFYPIQKAAEAALTRGFDFMEQQVNTYQSRRDVLMDRLNQAGWPLSKPPATMYVWTRTPGGRDSMDFTFRLMREAGIVVTPGKAFGPEGEGYVRISLVQPEDQLAKAAERINRF